MNVTNKEVRDGLLDRTNPAQTRDDKEIELLKAAGYFAIAASLDAMVEFAKQKIAEEDKQ